MDDFERITFPDKGNPSRRTMHCTALEGPLNCLSIDRNCSRVVVAGRNVFKVFSIEDDEFQERANLRVGKHPNLNFSASDVAWNPQEDNLLASAATNGAVVLWDLNKQSRSKLEYVFTDFRRTVNKVCFHSNEGNFLLAGSQDESIKLFDVRKRGLTSTFSGKSESVRDVQFCPHHYFMFAAAYENGNIMTWDMRNPSRCEKFFTGHSGPAFSIDWHPDEKHWLASAGRDKIIKVWDLSNAGREQNTHTVQTIASVARIKWRPQRRFHIASCALLIDFSINIWDIRRPYIPFAAFNEHKDVVTGIVWKHSDPHTFLSSSKDCRLYQHMFRDATRPGDNANPVGVHINIDGKVAYASSDRLTSNAGSRGSSIAVTKLPSFFRRQQDRSEQFTVANSTLSEISRPVSHELSMDWFVYCARNYKLTGNPLEELCEHNAQIAQRVGKHQVCQTWRMLKMLYSDVTMTTPTQPAKSVPAKTDAHDEPALRTVDNRTTTDVKVTEPDVKEKLIIDTSTGMSEEESDVQDVETERLAYLTNISGPGQTINSDFFDMDGELDQGFEYEALNNMQNGQEDWSLPNEAFQPRHEILERSSSPDPLAPQNGRESPSSANEIETNHHVISVPESSIKEELLGVTPFTSAVPSWKFTHIVCDMLEHYAAQGDIQMAASVLIILGEKIRSCISEITQEQWLYSYVDLLGRFQLWTVATEVIKLSGNTVVGALNLHSTRIHTSCGRCGRALVRTGWLCDKCDGAINTCSICHLPVKGLFIWCQGCSHGGHLHHITEWYKTNVQCPAGCGHQCEYT